MSGLALPLADVESPVEAQSPFRLGYRPWLDVDLFFVLSGFLITALLLEEREISGRISFRNFYARRFFRLFPALTLVLIASFLQMLFVPGVDRHYPTIAYALFYVINWVMALRLDHVSANLQFAWSLAIEEQFYLVWPTVLCLALWRGVRPRQLAFALFALFVFVCVYRCALLSHGATMERVAFASDTRADSLLIGCCVGVIAASGLLLRSIQPIRWTAAILAFLFGAYFVGFGRLESIGLSVAALFFASLLMLLLVDPPNALIRVLNSPLLVWTGKLSYSLYLWHLYTNFAVRHLPINRFLGLALSLSLSFAVAAASYYLVERPFLSLKRRFRVT
jgi:peptidoglycan/LPS O-acetylase OafA/YrhL